MIFAGLLTLLLASYRTAPTTTYLLRPTTSPTGIFGGSVEARVGNKYFP